MNPVRPCGCCLPTYCDACSPSTSPEFSGRKLKAEPQNKNHPICSTSSCVIFDSHDVNPFPEYPCPAKHIKAKNENRNSLGSPIGLVASNNNFKTEAKAADIIQARYATYLKAFARLHLNDETTWTPTLIDDIMKEGLILYTTSEKNENKLESPTNIYTASEKMILREFKMSGCNFQVELMEKFILSSAESEETGAKGDVNDNLKVEDLKPALKQFFRQHKYCLLTVKSSFYLMIWPTQDAYFIFDVCGRRVSDFRTDQDEGVAMLICLKTLENVRHLIVNLSTQRLTDPISIREIKMVKVTTPTGGVIQREYGTRTHQYQVINDDYAYLKASLHLTLNKADLLRNRSALPVAVAAMVASKIDHPVCWNTKLIDKILCFGVNFCQTCWLNCMINDAIDVTEFPGIFNMGQFRISIELIDRKYEGIWRCVPRFKYSDLTLALETAFNSKDQKLMVQINAQMYPIWKKHGFIYLFDPYRHRILGKQDDSEIYGQMEKTASLRMFRSFEVFMNTFNHILLDSNRTSQFYIHVLKIRNIQQQTAPDEEAKLGIDGEVVSLNEYICFEEAENLCQKALADISDFEDEDLKSDVDEMELKTSSSEAEDLMEEEETFGGEVEELEGLESSSSGEEDAGHKKKGAASKVKKTNKSRKMGRGGKSREGKGDKGNNNKGTKNDEGGQKRKNGYDNDESSSDEEKSKKKKNRSRANNGKSQKESDGKNPEEFVAKMKENHEGQKSEDKVKNKEKINKGKEEELDKEKRKNKNNEDKDAKDEKSKDDKSKAEKKKEVNEIKDKETNYLKKDENTSEINKDEDRDKDKNRKDLNKENVKKTNYRDKVGNTEKEQSEVVKNAEREKSVKDMDAASNKDGNVNKYFEKDMEKDKDKELEKEKRKDTNKSKERNKDLAKETDKDNNLAKNEDKNKENDRDQYKDKHEVNDFIKGNKTENENTKDISSLKANTILEFTGKENNIIKDKDIRLRTHSKVPYDAAEADDENEDNFVKKSKLYCSGPIPNNYPGYFKCPMDMAVVGSETGSYASICKLFQAGFKIADRILTMTPWGSFVVFRCLGKIGSKQKYYFIFDGCTCNVNSFRHLDLGVGTAGLLYFERMHNVIEYIRQVRKVRNQENQQRLRKETIDEICSQYCA